MALRRIQKEFNELSKNPPEGIRVILEGNDFFKWLGLMQGPKDTAYEGGIFLIGIEFPRDYPFKAPKTWFRTYAYSCNLNKQGRHCLEIDKELWSPSLTAGRILQSLLLTDPNPDDPMDAELATLYKQDRDQYWRNARLSTEKHAIAGHSNESLSYYYALFGDERRKSRIP